MTFFAMYFRKRSDKISKNLFNMKRLTYLLAGLALVAASCQNNSYTINGSTTYENVDGAQVILFYGDKSDTTHVTGNTFSFSGEVESSDIGIIRIDNTQRKMMYCYFVLEPGTLDIEVSPYSTCSGTPLNEIYTGYQTQKRKTADARRAALKQVQEDSSLTDEEKKAKSDVIWDEYYESYNALNSEIFTAHSNDVIGVEAMMYMNDSREIFDSLYNICGDVVKNHPDVQKEVKRYAQLDMTAPGKPFIDFTIENGNADGTPAKLSDYVGKGKYVLVDFWASWCGPCKAEMPNLANVYSQFKGDKFEIVGVAVWDERKDTEDILPKLPITWPVIYDAQKIPTDIYGINGIPQIILFGPDGTIIARDLRGEAITETLKKYL